MVGWHDEVNPSHLADLMHAIHNIPNLVQNWESCDEDQLKSTLLNYERYWQREGPCLHSVYERAIQQVT